MIIGFLKEHTGTLIIAGVSAAGVIMASISSKHRELPKAPIPSYLPSHFPTSS
jgi:hypothetical protein